MPAAMQDPGGPARLGLPVRLAIVFDLDGTLIDSRRDIAEATNYALEQQGFSRLSVDEIASYVGDGARLLVARAARVEPSSAVADRMVDSFLEYYVAHPTDHTTLLPGAHEALSALRHLPLCLCTNKPRASTDAVLARLPLPAPFTVVVAGGDLPKIKPDPMALEYIAQKLSLRTPQLVMVGDGPQDILCAKAAGARSVGVEGGIQAHERLVAAAPDELLRSLHELPALVERWLGTANGQPMST